MGRKGPDFRSSWGSGVKCQTSKTRILEAELSENGNHTAGQREVLSARGEPQGV